MTENVMNTHLHTPEYQGHSAKRLTAQSQKETPMSAFRTMQEMNAETGELSSCPTFDRPDAARPATPRHMAPIRHEERSNIESASRALPPEVEFGPLLADIVPSTTSRRTLPLMSLGFAVVAAAGFVMSQAQAGSAIFGSPSALAPEHGKILLVQDAPKGEMDFLKVDGDADGAVTLEEATKAGWTWTQEQFTAADKDANGSLSADEFVTATSA
jgi:hypothetical protein